MTTLDNGIVIEEAITAHNLTPDALVPGVFGYPSKKTGVTVHHWGNPGQKFDDVVRYLASNNARSSSAHFVLQEDRVACIVSPDDAAWHAGSAEGNATTIGIECRPEMTPGDLETLVSLIRHLESVYGSLLVYKHSDWSNTACPGKYGGAIQDIVNAVNNVRVGTTPPVPPSLGDRHKCCCHDD